MTDIVSSILGPLAEKLASSAVEEIQLVCGVKDDQEKLKNTLEMIQEVLADAEQKQTKNEAVRRWLSKLKDFCYDAEDVLDEFEAVALWRRARSTERSTLRRKVRYLSSWPSNSIFQFKMAHKMKELRKRLDGINEEKTQFNLLSNVQEKTIVPRRETHSFVPASNVIGRDEEKERIIKLLIRSDDGGAGKIAVIPILGMGGTGKTTLAKLVYNDDSVNEHFDHKVWLSMPVEFEVKKTIRDIIESLGDKENSDRLEKLQERLRDLVKDKKCLFVMDDVWEMRREDWVGLRDLLGGVSEGSKVIVTSRIKSIAEIMGTVPPLHLANLSEEESLTLFVKCAFDQGQEQNHPDLMVIAKEIVGKCGGNPLAVKTLGCLLYSQKKNRGNWERVRDSETWQLPNDTLTSLRISYDLMPSYLKRCFAYCSIFLKNQEFFNLDLIQLWISNGFIQSGGNNQELEEIGRQYLEELWSRSFFDVVMEDYPFLSFRMHDLIHELAISVAQTESSNMKVRAQDISPTTRHVSFPDPPLLPKDEVSRCLSKLSGVRTIFLSERGSSGEFFLERCISRFKHLRVLWLEESSFDQLPSSIGGLKHLRCLSLRCNFNIKKLPKSICELRNLQCLDLVGCTELEELPADMKNMISLRVLWINTKQQRLPESGIGCLTSLRWLSIGGCDNLEALFDDIQSLTSLRKLLITFCPKLASLPQGIKNLKALEDLWIVDCENLRLPEGESNEPSSMSRLLSIRFKGLPELVSFPGWLEGSTSTLERIRIEDCPNLSELPEWLQNCSSLRELEIKKCPGLTSLPQGIKNLKALEDLWIEDCDSLRLPEGESNEASSMSRLQTIRFKGLPELVSFPGWLEGSASTLQKIRIEDCPKLSELPEWLQNCSSLRRKVEIKECPGLTSIPDGVRRIATLTELRIIDCEGIEQGSDVEEEDNSE
ncbi:putative disease resistance protein RGA1 [Rhodamnia argentea]|uniref:Disease resistance protein RGA1 n=1 Tax=Rhodamnia argentea TaxID=178133 RepID=A0A8B8MRE2_9MYRT|nr:putative disease resistance protein RGA1 [Rhodamnia argentea]